MPCDLEAVIVVINMLLTCILQVQIDRVGNRRMGEAVILTSMAKAKFLKWPVMILQESYGWRRLNSCCGEVSQIAGLDMEEE